MSLNLFSSSFNHARAQILIVAPNADPVVCKLLDYHKEKFQKKKQAQRVERRTLGRTPKEIKMKVTWSSQPAHAVLLAFMLVRTQGLIEHHDLVVKTTKIAEALKKRHSVKVVVSCNVRMLRERPSCLEELPARIFEILGNQAKDSFRVHSQKQQAKSLEIVLIPK